MKLAIIILYGLSLLAIGIYSAFKIKTPSDYFIAGKRTGILQLTGSLLATILGAAAVLGTIELAQTQSWAAAWYILCASLGLLVLIPVVKRISKQGRFTLSGLIGLHYGEAARKTASVLIPLAWLGIVAAQIIAAAQILNSFFNLDYSLGVLFSGTLFILYTYIGGQVSVIRTDFFQSIVILMGVIATCIFLFLNKEVVSAPFFGSFPFNPALTPIDLLILILTFSSTFVVGPDIYSRLFCAKNEHVSQRSVLYTALLLIPLAFMLAYIGICAANLGSYTQGTSALVNMINRFLPEWMVGLMVVALISAVLSSASTTLLTASTVMSELVRKDIDNPRSFKHTKLFVMLIGCLSMLMAFKVTSIISSLLLALSFYSGAFIVPMFAALFQIPHNKKYAVIAMVTGGIIALAGKLSLTFYQYEYGNWIIVTGFTVNAIILFMVPKKKQKKTIKSRVR